jgi:hypothetical protein
MKMRKLSDKGEEYLEAIKKRAARDYARGEISKEKLDKIIDLIEELLKELRKQEVA